MQRKIKRIKLGRQIYRRLMKRVLERDGWRCQRCGKLENLRVHHKIKRSQQGDDALENLVTLCAYCHIPADRETDEVYNFLRGKGAIKGDVIAPAIVDWGDLE